ncbi:NAD-dependent epimerase/dehydratase family protein [Caulobacter segnis]
MRYFNAAGADPLARIGEWHEPESHAIPLAIAAAREPDRPFTVFGEDYATRDGTAVRDYVHVLDLADAHVLALKRLLGGAPSGAFNLGTGVGTTVRELVDGVSRVAGRPAAEDGGASARRPRDAGGRQHRRRVMSLAGRRLAGSTISWRTLGGGMRRWRPRQA